MYISDFRYLKWKYDVHTYCTIQNAKQQGYNTRLSRRNTPTFTDPILTVHPHGGHGNGTINYIA